MGGFTLLTTQTVYLATQVRTTAFVTAQFVSIVRRRFTVFVVFNIFNFCQTVCITLQLAHIIFQI